MAQKFKNNSTSLLANSISAVATSFTVLQGEGQKFPDIDPGDAEEFAMITLEDDTGNFEIVRCNGRTGDIFDITGGRGAESTTPAAFSATTTRVELRLTAFVAGQFLQRDGDTIDGGTY